MSAVWRVRAGFLRDARVDLSYPLSVVGTMVAAFFTPLLFYFIARFVGDGVEDELAGSGGDYFAYVLVGVLWSNFLYVSSRVFASGMREAQLAGFLESLLQTPTRAATLLASQGAWPYTLAVVQAVITLLVGVVVLGVNLDVNVPAALVATLISGLATTAIGMAMAAVVLLVKRGEGIVFLGLSTLLLFGGFYYPVSSLPAPLDTIGDALPISHAVEALRRSLLEGDGLGALAGELAPIAVFAVVALPLAARAVEAAVDQCRRRGTLGQY